MIAMPIWVFVIMLVYSAFGAIAFLILLWKLIEFIKLTKEANKHK